jgi:hypothetical protein
MSFAGHGHHTQIWRFLEVFSWSNTHYESKSGGLDEILLTERVSMSVVVMLTTEMIKIQAA